MTNFSDISARYENHSVVQKSASEQLFDLARIEESDDVLDIGCGTGNLTRRIVEKTTGRVAGIDASEGMIEEAIRRCSHLGVRFNVCPVERMTHENCFDVILCNSAFQWFKNPEPALKACYQALKRNGRMAIQAPARKVYSPNFIEAVERAGSDPRLKRQFESFETPWFFLETPEEYRALFQNAGFEVPFSKIERVVSLHTPEEVYRIFDSGAAAGYLNPEFYRLPIRDDYAEAFRETVREAFEDQAESDGRVDLIFFRIYLLATKS